MKLTILLYYIYFILISLKFSFQKNLRILNDNYKLNENNNKNKNKTNQPSITEILTVTIIGIIILLIIIIIFYKYFLDYYINSNSIPNFNNVSKLELKKYYLFQKLMQFTYYKNDKEEICPICLEKFNKNISKICTTPCNHIFHFYCLKKYVFQFNNLKCPLCKKEYLKDNNFNLYGIRVIPLNENDNPIYETKYLKGNNKNNDKNIRKNNKYSELKEESQINNHKLEFLNN